LKPDLENKTKIERYGSVTFSDKVDYGQEIVSDIKDLKPKRKYDGIIFNPLYFFGYKGSDDLRKQDYGDYIQTIDDLVWFMDFANQKFPNWLKSNGKALRTRDAQR
jgi:hypothetical protein